MKIFVFLVVFWLVGVFIAPAFLVCSQKFKKVDCIVVMIGGGTECRIRGAEQLVKKGQSKVLLIPAFSQMAVVGEFGLGKMGSVNVAPVVGRSVRFLGRRYRVFENTHLEMLKGKKIMDKLGYRSAIIVSSPYHMRRLQLIARKVFGDYYRIGFEATPFEKYDTLGCFKSWEAFVNVGSEYLKIGWFLIYCWFV